MVDPANRVWIAADSYGGIDSPHVWMRNPDFEYWGQPDRVASGFRRFTNKTAVSSFSAAMDSGTRAVFNPNTTNEFAMWNIVCAFIDGAGPNNAFYGDIGTTDESIHAAGTYVEVKIVAQSGGWKTAFLRDASRNLYATAKFGTGATQLWSAPTLVANTCDSIEAVAINPANEQPAVMWMSGTDLYISEFDNLTPVWNHTEVKTVAQDHAFYTGQSFCYDELGSVMVIGPYDWDNLGRAEVTQWNLNRGEGSSTWVASVRTATSGGDVAQSLMLYSPTPCVNGFCPVVPAQHCFYFSYIWGAGLTIAQQGIAWVNPDTVNGAETSYPSIFSAFTSEPFPNTGLKPTPTQTEIPDPTPASETFPSTLKEGMEFFSGDRFISTHFRFDKPYKGAILRATDHVEVWSISFPSLSNDEVNTLLGFLLPKIKTGQRFFLQRPDIEETNLETVSVLGEPGSPIRVPGTMGSSLRWTYSFQVGVHDGT